MEPPVLVSPKNSFIKFTVDGHPVSLDPENDCCEDGDFCIPVVNADDNKFQFRLLFETQAEAYDFARAPGNQAQLVILRGGHNDVTTATANLIRNLQVDGLDFVKTITGEKEVTFYWPHAITTEDAPWPLGLGCDACFQLAVIISEDPDNIRLIPTHFANCMIKKCGTCDTAVIEYICDDDEYDFRYCNFDNAVNRVRLPMYIRRPQPTTVKKVFVTSKGKENVTSSRTSQTWEGLIDFVPKWIHFALALAMEHDTVNIYQDGYTGGFRVGNNYAIDWAGSDSECVAQGSFKGNATPYDARNSNCKICADCPEILDFELDNLFYDFELLKQSFTFTYTILGPSPAYVILESKLHAATEWTQSIQANISPINILLDLGVYDFRIVPQSNNCLPDYSSTIDSQGSTEAPACTMPTEVNVTDITSASAIATWPAVIPAPVALYDWRLIGPDNVTIVAHDEGHWNSGGLVVGLTGLTADTDYHFQVRSNCSISNHSAWANVDFHTLP